MADTIIEMVKTNKTNKTNKYMNFIIITPAPNETFGEYTDIFDNYNDFDLLNIKITVLKDRNNIQFHENSNNVFIVSKQRLGWSKIDEDKTNDENTDKIIDNINKLLEPIINNLSAIFLDEAHFGMSTDKAQLIVKTLDKFKTIPKIYVTATYNKPSKVYGITEESTLIWDLKDIKDMKEITSDTLMNNNLVSRFGKKIYTDAIKSIGKENEEEIIQYLKDEYSIYPKPYMITSIWNPDIINIEKTKIGNKNYGFDMDKLFMTDNDINECVNNDQVIEAFRYYFGKPDNKLDYSQQDKYKNFGIIPRIKNISSKNKCRTMQTGHVTANLWFLPTGGLGKIENRVTAILKILNLNEFKKLQYHYYVAIEVNNKNKINTPFITYMKNSKNIKSEINNTTRLIKENKINGENLIILAGNRLQLGISLKDVDIVTLWNNSSSSDAIYQMLFRCMTEVDITKKFGFMVDMNPQRVMTDVMLFSDNIIYKNNASDTEVYRQITDLINIDSDMLHIKHGDNPSQEQRDDFVNELFGKLYENWNMDVENTIKIAENFDYDTDIINNISNELRKIRLSKKAKQTQKILDEQEDEIDSGKKKEKVSKKDHDELDKELKKIKDDVPIEKIAAELIGELISLLNIFTLYIEENTNCILLNDENDKKININIITRLDILKDKVYSDKVRRKDFLKILNGRLGGNDDHEYNNDIVEFVIKSVSDKKDISYIEKIIHAQKQAYYGITDPVKLLEDINNNLAPKETEKKEKGEVFTPPSIIYDMLKPLPKDVWINPYLKWLDNSAGTGIGSIIVYLELMKSLKNHKDKNIDLTDEEDRRKHILEKMIYIVEISEKNIFILNKIFCGINGGGKYKLNIYNKSFINKPIIENDSNSWIIDIKFNVIMVNPPYNPPKKNGKSVGSAFWQNFVMKSFYMLSEKGFLVFIHPPGWKKPTLEIFNEDKFLKSNDFTKQIRQGQVWQVLRNHGAFNYIYTNDQRSKNVEYINYFPAVDYYVYQKNGDKSYCNTKNVFNGKIYESTNVKLNYESYYLPNLITNESQYIINKIINKNDIKLKFKRGISEGSIIRWDGLEIDWYYDANKKGFQFKKHGETPIMKKAIPIDTVNINKIVINFGGGIDGYNVEYVPCNEKKGVVEMCMYTKIDNDKVGKHIKEIYKSPIAKYMFLITQYSSGKMMKNEPLVANSISIPPIDYNGDLYEFYGIEEYKKHIDDFLKDYDESMKPKSKKKEIINDNKECSNSDNTTFKQRINDKGIKQIYNEKTKRWNNDTPSNRKKLAV